MIRRRFVCRADALTGLREATPQLISNGALAQP